MKTTEFLKESPEIAQEAALMRQDHEVQMARADCYNAADYAIQIHRMLKHVSEQEGIEGWVSEKITTANNALRDVAEYLRYEKNDEQTQMMEFMPEAANHALRKLIAEGHDDTEMVGFSVDSERAYQAVMDRYGDMIEHHESGIMYAPRRIWGRIQELAYEADGIGAEEDTGYENPEHYGMAEGETGEERDASANRERDRYDNASNYQGRNARGDVIRSGGEVVRGNPNPPSLLQKAAGKLGLPNTATDALGDPMYKSSRPKSGGGGGGSTGIMQDPEGAKSRFFHYESKQSVKEDATGGSSSSSGMAISMSGPAHKPTTGVPKKLGNSHKPKKVTVGKGVYK